MENGVIMHCKPWVRVSTRCSLVRPAYQMRAIKYCVVSASALRKETSSYPLACIGIFSGTWCSGLGQYWTPVLCVSLCRPSLLIANESNHKFKLQQVLFWSRGLGLCFVQWQIRSTGLHPLNFNRFTSLRRKLQSLTSQKKRKLNCFEGSCFQLIKQ